MLPESSEILIVGAGPTGLLLAVELQRRGFDTVLIDRHDRPLTWDRATVIHPRSLEVLESLGLIDDVLVEGVRQGAVHVHSDGDELGSLDLALSGSRYPFNLGVSEEVTERVLTRRLEELGGSVERGAKLVALDGFDSKPADRQDRSSPVTATIEHDESTSTVATSWVVGCDGFHGVTRGLVGIDEEIRDLDRSWVVFDTTLEPWDVDDCDTHAYFDEPMVMTTALPHRRWRVYVHTSEGGRDAVTSSLDVLRRYHPPIDFVDVENVSAFTCHTRIASRYRRGRVLLAGDAAHVCSPAQGHGMNSGLHDAQNLGWKLALVARGVATDELLDSYELERRPIAELYLREGTDTEAIVTPRGQAERSTRDAAMRDRLTNPTTRHLDTVAEAELDTDLRASPIVHGGEDRSIAAGNLLPQATKVGCPDGTGELLARIAVDELHIVLLIAGGKVARTDLESLISELAETVHRLAVADRVVAVLEQDLAGRIRSMPSGVLLVSIDSVGLQELDTAPDEIVLLAVRPDGVIGTRAHSDHVDELEQYECRLLNAELS